MLNSELNQSDREIQQSIVTYLDGSRLSLNQVAHKWKISSPMLSQVKNGRRKCGIDLALKILRETGADVNQRKAWLETRYFEESKEASLVLDTIKKDRVKKNLVKSFSERLANNPTLADIFWDVVFAGESGVSWNSIFQTYGDNGIKLATSMIDLGLVKYLDGKYVIVEDHVIHVMDAENSFDFLSGTLSRMKEQVQADNINHHMKFKVDDVSDEGYKKLKELHDRYVEDFRKIMDESQQHTSNGGKRVIMQSMLGILKTVILVCGVAMGFATDMSWAGGGFEGGSGFVTRAPGTNLGHGMDWAEYRITIGELRASDRRQAISDAEAIVQQMRRGQVADRIVSRILHGPTHAPAGCQDVQFPDKVRRLLREGKFAPKELYVKDGKLRFDRQGNATEVYPTEFHFFFPCSSK